ncbi:unnamed protein product [Caenorhabditis nigoni]
MNPVLPEISSGMPKEEPIVDRPKELALIGKIDKMMSGIGVSKSHQHHWRGLHLMDIGACIFYALLVVFVPSRHWIFFLILTAACYSPIHVLVTSVIVMHEIRSAQTYLLIFQIVFKSILIFTFPHFISSIISSDIDCDFHVYICTNALEGLTNKSETVVALLINEIMLIIFIAELVRFTIYWQYRNNKKMDLFTHWTYAVTAKDEGTLAELYKVKKLRKYTMEMMKQYPK